MDRGRGCLISVDWAGGAGVFLGGSNSKLLTIADLGRVVREAINSQQWGFNWWLVRQVRTMSEGAIVLGGTSATAGKLVLNSKFPAHEAKLSAEGRRADGLCDLHAHDPDLEASTAAMSRLFGEHQIGRRTDRCQMINRKS
jgi:hypothetical protein